MINTNFLLFKIMSSATQRLNAHFGVKIFMCVIVDRLLRERKKTHFNYFY